MKKVSRPPTPQRQTGNHNRDRSTEGRSFGAHTLACDFKKSISPKTLDILLAIKYRR